MSRESGRKKTGETSISSTTDKFVVYASNVTWCGDSVCEHMVIHVH